MISNQMIQASIDELKSITKVDFCVIDMEGIVVASTFENKDVSQELVENFASSPADSQIVGDYHMLKVLEEKEVSYVLISKGTGAADAYMIGRIAVSQIQNLMIAYKEHFDKSNFFQNMPRVVYLVEAQNDKDNVSMELLKNLFAEQPGYYLTAVEQKNIIIIKELVSVDAYDEVAREAQVIVDMMNSEAMLITRVSYGTIVGELKEVSKSYKEAKMAMDVGKFSIWRNRLMPTIHLELAG